MLSKKTFPKDYIERCQSKIENDISEFDHLFKTINEVKANLNDTMVSFEHCYFNNLVLVLETLFIHRMRGKEGKDGNPLKEVRMLSNSIMENNYKMAEKKSIKYKPEHSILQYQIGDEIKLTQLDFVKLSKAFFEDLKSKYLE